MLLTCVVGSSFAQSRLTRRFGTSLGELKGPQPHSRGSVVDRPAPLVAFLESPKNRHKAERKRGEARGGEGPREYRPHARTPVASCSLVESVDGVLGVAIADQESGCTQEMKTDGETVFLIRLNSSNENAETYRWHTFEPKYIFFPAYM